MCRSAGALGLLRWMSGATSREHRPAGCSPEHGPSGCSPEHGPYGDGSRCYRRRRHYVLRVSTAGDLPGVREGWLEIVTLAAQGRPNRDIADALVLSLRTVENHLSRAYRYLEVDGRMGLGPLFG